MTAESGWASARRGVVLYIVSAVGYVVLSWLNLRFMIEVVTSNVLSFQQLHNIRYCVSLVLELFQIAAFVLIARAPVQYLSIGSWLAAGLTSILVLLSAGMFVSSQFGSEPGGWLVTTQSWLARSGLFLPQLVLVLLARFRTVATRSLVPQALMTVTITQAVWYAMLPTIFQSEKLLGWGWWLVHASDLLSLALPILLWQLLKTWDVAPTEAGAIDWSGVRRGLILYLWLLVPRALLACLALWAQSALTQAWMKSPFSSPPAVFQEFDLAFWALVDSAFAFWGFSEMARCKDQHVRTAVSALRLAQGALLGLNVLAIVLAAGRRSALDLFSLDSGWSLGVNVLLAILAAATLLLLVKTLAAIGLALGRFDLEHRATLLLRHMQIWWGVAGVTVLLIFLRFSSILLLPLALGLVAIGLMVLVNFLRLIAALLTEMRPPTSGETPMPQLEVAT